MNGPVFGFTGCSVVLRTFSPYSFTRCFVAFFAIVRTQGFIRNLVVRLPFFFFFFFPSPSVHLDAVRRRCATSVKPHIKVVVRVLHSTSYLFVFFKVTYDSAGGQLRVEGPEATDIAFDELLKWLNAYLPCFGVVSSPRKEDTAGSWRSANIAAAGGSGNTTFFFACTGLIVTLRVARTADGGFACVTRECWGEVSGEKAHARRIRRKT